MQNNLPYMSNMTYTQYIVECIRLHVYILLHVSVTQLTFLLKLMMISHGTARLQYWLTKVSSI